jgi:hypothetical protein
MGGAVSGEGGPEESPATGKMIRKERTGTSAPFKCGIPEAAAFGGGNSLNRDYFECKRGGFSFKAIVCKEFRIWEVESIYNSRKILSILQNPVNPVPFPHPYRVSVIKKN